MAQLALLLEKEKQRICETSLKNALIKDRRIEDLIQSEDFNFYSSFKQDLTEIKYNKPGKDPLKNSEIFNKKYSRCASLQFKSKICDSALIVISLIGPILEIINYEINCQNIPYNRYKDINLNNRIKVLTFCTTIFSIFLALLSSNFTYSSRREMATIFKEKTTPYFQSRCFFISIAQISILIVIPLPFTDHEFEFTQLGGSLFISLNLICVSFMMLRFLLLLRLFLFYTDWSSLKTQNSCREVGADKPLIFTMKAFLKDRPHLFLIPVFAISTFAFGVALQIYEGDFINFQSESIQSYGYLYNAMWLILLTLTTVGYGDIYARSHIGRLLTILALIWGTFLVSLMILMLNNYVVFSKRQEKSYQFIAKQNNLKKARFFAEKFISQFLLIKIYKNYRRVPDKHPIMKHLYLELNYFHSMFRENLKKARFSNDSNTEYIRSFNERLGFRLESFKKIQNPAKKLENEVEEIIESQKKTLDLIQHCKKIYKESFYLFEYK